MGLLLDSPGRRAGPVISYKQELADACSEMTVDGHAIALYSLENDLGYGDLRLTYRNPY